MSGNSPKLRVSTDFKKWLDIHSRKYGLSRVRLSQVLAEHLNRRRKI
jgi:hypothetical protein